jgi:hypothetical protein
MRKIFRKFRFVFLAVIVLVFIAVLLQVKFPFSTKSPCLFLAQQEWSLIHDVPDKILAQGIRNDSSSAQNFSLLQFSRQDYVDFSLQPDIKIGCIIKKDQVVATLFSHENQIRVSQTRALLNQAKANLHILAVGEKQPLQEEAVQAVRYAKAAFETFKPEFERKQKMLQEKLISQSDFDSAAAAYQLRGINIELQEARLKALQTGAKPEELDLVRTEIAGLEDEIELLEAKLAADVIKSPIGGIVVEPDCTTILFRVNKIDTLVVHIPIGEELRQYVHKGEPVVIYSYNSPLIYKSTVKNIGHTAKLINRRPMFIAECIVDNADQKILPGMSGVAKVQFGRYTLLELLDRLWISGRFLRIFS